MPDQPESTLQAVRADVWLWAARFFKTRSIVKQAIEGGKVEINGGSCKPAKLVRPGDRFRITRGQERLECEVLALAENRGPAPEAQRLYRETDESRLSRDKARADSAAGGAVLRTPSRPGKKARRLLRDFKHSF